MANYFQIFPPLVFSYRLFIFTNRGNFQVRTWVWRKFAVENRVNFQIGDWTGVKWSSQSRKTNFLTLPDLAFGFVHKRSGNEIIWYCVVQIPLPSWRCMYMYIHFISWPSFFCFKVYRLNKTSAEIAKKVAREVTEATGTVYSTLVIVSKRV